MRWGRLAFLAGWLALSGVGARADDIIAQPATEWKVGAIRQKSSGVFAYCAAEAKFERGLTMALARNPKGSLNIAIGFPNPALDTGAGGKLKLDIDGKTEKIAPSTIPSPDLLVIQAGEDQAFYDKLISGKTLTIVAAHDRISFGLKGSGAALKGLRACVDANTGQAQTAEPAAAPPPPAPTPADKPAPLAGAPEQAEAYQRELPSALNDILKASGLGPITLLDIGGDPEKRPMDFAWLAFGRIFGGAKETPLAAPADLDQMVQAHAERLRAGCHGRFSSEMSAALPGEGLTLATAELACQGDPEHDWVMAIVYFSTPHVFTFISHEAKPADGALARKARDGVLGALEKLAGH